VDIKEVMKRLASPFPLEAISWRVGATNKEKTKGIALAYIDARDVMDRLDQVVGPENWQCRYPFTGCCEIGINIEGGWVWKANGAGVTDYEAEKGQYSDAFKRSAVMWGIGRYLYHLPNEWVLIEPYGKSYKLKTKPSLPNWAIPGKASIVPKDIVEKVIEQSLHCLDIGDEPGLREIWAEFDTDEKAYLWRNFNSAQRGTMAQFLKGE
jgi:hypothetical protein